jgi:UPF0755 protein
MKNSPQLKAGVILTISILFITFSFTGYQYFFTPNLLVEDDSPKEAVLYIPRNAHFKQVVDSLMKSKILHDNLSFSFVSKVMKYQDNVKPGRYIIKENSTNLEVVKKLKRGDEDPLNVTFNNIRTKQELAEKLSQKLEPKAEDLLKLMNDTAFVSSFGFDTSSIVALFIPNTYEFFWTVSPKEVFERMNQESEKFWSGERDSLAKSLGLSRKEVMILASIVEAETNQDSEKPRIAGVYLNRYNQGWPLQADPTVKFALHDFSIRRVIKAHTEFDSPYNTYKYLGLPPGPINLPSIPSIDAVLNSENHDYMFFVADLNNPGYHKFSKDYRSHVNLANRYRKDLNKRNIF